ncbi:glycosyltransferase family 4 protein [Pyrococcus horikoshii]|nr:glycosyltransferase family 4 protein [Pyrococcus horikoshii]HII60987.1 glycosyltransferase family 4 protein [Pyrococcus horikoshii]
MKVSILTPNFSSNCLGRAYLLAQLISQFSEVEIVGPALAKDVWEPLSNQADIPFKVINWSSTAFIKKISSAVSGDVIYASKPLINSFGVALIIHQKTGIPVILDIDDWELGFVKDSANSVFKLPFYAFPHRFNGFQSISDVFLLEKTAQLLREEISITVSNSFLQKMFGGTIIWHTRDENVFNPKKYDPEESRRSFGIPEDKVVLMFFGTPRPHKGLEELIQAIYTTEELRNNQELTLVIGGIGKDLYSQKIAQLGKKLLGDKVIFIGHVPFEETPKAVVASDIYIIPQKKTYASFGQLPAKLFDAMAMARAIISTNVSDIPRILDGVGIVISSETLEKNLSEEILYLVENLDEARKLGTKARRRFVKLYGFNPMRKKLERILRTKT